MGCGVVVCVSDKGRLGMGIERWLQARSMTEVVGQDTREMEGKGEVMISVEMIAMLLRPDVVFRGVEVGPLDEMT